MSDTKKLTKTQIGQLTSPDQYSAYTKLQDENEQLRALTEKQAERIENLTDFIMRLRGRYSHSEHILKWTDEILSKQEPLGEEFSKVLHDNLSDLYETTQQNQEQSLTGEHNG